MTKRLGAIALSILLVTPHVAIAERLSVGDRTDITLLDGTVYKSAKIQDVSANGIIVVNSQGINSVQKSSLTPEFSALVAWPAAPTPTPKPSTPTETSPSIQSIFGTGITNAAPITASATPASSNSKIKKPTEKPDYSPLSPYLDVPERALLSTILKGQCFIVTKGGTNYKLGDVMISVYSLGEYNFYNRQIINRRKILDAAWEPYQKDRSSKGDYAESIAALSLTIDYNRAAYSLIPAAEFSCPTDADGRYEIEHKLAKPYIVVARAKRSVGKDDEYYVWEILSSEIPQSGQLMLTNRNLRD